MAYGPPICACCGDRDGVEEHPLYPRVEACPTDLTVWLCHACYGQATASLPVLNGLRKVAVLGTATRQAKAAARAQDLMLMLLELFSQGITGHAALARALNQRMVSAPWGGQ